MVAIDSILQKFERFGVRLGLESVQQLLAALGNPQEQIPIVHVAGSNGKGSVCAYLSAVLTEAGYRVGRYTSPHLVSWCERICLNEQPISPNELEHILNQVVAAISSAPPSPTQFEVITAAAWLYFAQQKVDIAVVEVGLGGRLDATNVCDRPLVSIITSISREHWQRLGPTLADIAREKAGILKPGCPAVIGQLPPEAQVVVAHRIAELGCPAVYPEPAIIRQHLQDSEAGSQQSGIESRELETNSKLKTQNSSFHSPIPLDLSWAEFRGIRYPLPLRGEIQLHNSALAIAALQILRQQGWEISDDAIAKGMANTRWPGRLQWFTWRGHKILIDGAHNPASAEVLRQYVDSLINHQNLKNPAWKAVKHPYSLFSIHWVMGMLSTKDHADILKVLLRAGDRLYLTPVPDHNSANLETLVQLAQTVCPDLTSCQTYPDVFSALEAATTAKTALAQPSLTVLCGSLYLVGHFFKQNGGFLPVLEDQTAARHC